jgi:hypothetical protein
MAVFGVDREYTHPIATPEVDTGLDGREAFSRRSISLRYFEKKDCRFPDRHQ